MQKKNGLKRRNLIKGLGITAAMAASNVTASVSFAQSNGAGRKAAFDEVYSRVGVNSIKWDSAIRRYGSDKIVVPMGIADMDFKVDPTITAAINKRARNEIYGYETVSDEYYQSIIDWNKTRYGLDLKREWIRNSSALKPGLVAALRGLNPIKGKVILQTPTYSGFTGAINKAGMRVEMNPMKKIDGRWHMDLEDLESRLDYETKCLILCNPNNPSGECWTADELRALGDVCMRNGVTVLADEIWCDFVRGGGRYVPYASIGEKYAEHSITFKSVSKSFNQASLKVAYFFTRSEDLMNATMIGGGHDVGTNTYGRIAAETAYREGEQWLDNVNEYLDGNFDYLVEYINKSGEMPGIKYAKPEGTYVAWLDCNGLKEKIATPDHVRALHDKWRDEGNHRRVTPEMVMTEWFVENAGVQLNAGHSYGIGAEGFMRMNITVPRHQLKLALDNINGALKAL